MARKKTNIPFRLIGGVIVLGIIAKTFEHIWPLLIFAVLIFCGYRWHKANLSRKSLAAKREQFSIPSHFAAEFAVRSSFSTPSEPRIPVAPEELPPNAKELPVSVKQNSPVEPVKITDFTVSKPSGYRIPVAPKELSGGAKWISVGESVEINGLNIPNGMLYVGAQLPSIHGSPDPALIDPRKPVARTGDFTERQTNYWPSYSEISPQARKAYLQWLADGRRHPDADIAYVFLFYYGLERRILIDATKDKAAEADRPHIIAELKRLLGIYGAKSGSFTNYCGHLLELLELSEYPAKLYEKPVPELQQSFELPFYLRLALGQAAIDGVPIPAHIAVAWVEHEPAIVRRTAVTRCQDEFRRLFHVKYRQQYGEGMKVAVNRTKLKFTYQPASAGLRSTTEVNLRFGEIPDITALTSPVKKLQLIVESCCEELDSYSRFIGRNPDKQGALEALLLLPVLIWPQAARKALETFSARVGEGLVAMPLQELVTAFNTGSGELSREKVQGLARALESEKIGIEPDVLGGAKNPKPDETVVLFKTESVLAESRATSAYQAALVTLELGAAVAHADGDFCTSELMLLNTHVDSWMHLTPAHRLRLKAHTRLLMAAPVSLTSLKKKIEPLDTATREAVASFAAILAQADGKVTHEEVKLLEKIYKLLGVDQQKVYSDIHAIVASEGKTSSSKTAPGGFALDVAKIAALQQDSEKLSALLGNIFSEDAEQEVLPVPVTHEDSTENNKILDLDESHSAFARMLLSRPSWSRGELVDVAQDLEVMLDGALERLNEATLDAYDILFTDGDDPFEINPEIIEKLAL